MGFYSRVIFPRMINLVMDTGPMKKVRTAVLSGVSGDVFELGFGTGLNLPFYPDGVSRITTADVNPAMDKFARKRIAESRIEVECRTLNGESLPMDDETFDSVVCTWTLCSIEHPDKALAEVRRVLKPNGRFFFVEHGLADDAKVRRWQHRLTPLQKIIGDGCHLNRNVKELVQDAGFKFDEMETYYMDKTPRMFGYFYQGVASRT